MAENAHKGLPNLMDFTPPEMEGFIAASGKEKYRARQLLKALHQSGCLSFEAMTTLARDFRKTLAETARIYRPSIVKIQKSPDGTQKVLLALEDGLFIESVLIPGKNHWTLCISTQAGCAMGCAFCLTARQGFKRNLTPAEIAGQVVTIRQETPEGAAVGNILLMGMGEPLANYDHTVKAIRILTSDLGLGFSSRRITVSTCGLTPQILQLGRDICINLAVSLNASDDETRSRLMPVNKKYPLAALLDACQKYPMPGRRMLTYEYILIDGVNASRADAQKLARLLADQRCKINLIAFNEYPGSPYKTPSPEAISAFQQVLLDRHFTAMLRKSKGADILAACGQLSGAMTPS